MPHPHIFLFTACLSLLSASVARATLPDAASWGSFSERHVHCGRSSELLREYRSDSTHNWDALAYRAQLQLDPSSASQQLGGSMEILFRSEVALLDTLDLHLVGFDVSLALQDQVPLEVLRDGDRLFLPLNQPVAQNDSSVVSIDYEGVPQLRDGLGLSGMGSGIVYTVSDPWGTRLWLPCYDEPWDKALWSLEVQVPGSDQVLCNGVEYTLSVGPDDSTVWSFEHDAPMSSYLVSLVAGNLLEIHEQWQDIPLRWLVYPSHESQAALAYSRVDQMFDCFTGLWGDYPFDAYSMGEAGIYGGFGGMEHQTCTTIGSGIVAGGLSYESVIAHELSHQWWGDAVTPVDFRQVWLNEGWATYAEAYYYQHLADGDWAAFVDYMGQIHQTYLSWDSQLIPIFDPPLNNLFNISQYEKAASVIHMLRLLLGEDVFHEAQRSWLATHLYGTVDTWEYRDHMEDASGLDLDWFFDQWIFSGGYPSYEYSVAHQPVDGGTQVYLTVEQEHQVLDSFRMPVPVRVLSTEAVFDTLLLVDDDWQDLLVELPGDFDTLLFNHDSWILCRQEQRPTPTEFSLEIVAHEYDDSQLGNGDGSLADGEAASLALYVRNNGRWLSNVSIAPVVLGEVEVSGQFQAVDSWGMGEIRRLEGDVQVWHPLYDYACYGTIFFSVTADGGTEEQLQVSLPLGDARIQFLGLEAEAEMWHWTRQDLDSLALFTDATSVGSFDQIDSLMQDHDVLMLSSCQESARLPLEYLDMFNLSWQQGVKGLFIGGQDALDEMTGAFSIQNASIEHLDVPDVAVDGEAGSSFDGMSALLIGAGGAQNQFSPSSFEEEAADFGWEVLARYRNSQFPAMLRLVPEEGGMPIILAGFGLEAISGMANTNSRREWLWSLMQELGGTELDMDPMEVPTTLVINSISPNPFNPATTLSYTLRQGQKLEINLFNLLGQRVASLHSGPVSAGKHHLRIDGGNLASGLYILSVNGERESLHQKLLLLR
jgi:hypothetical protein